jgi:HlyD family secretion protein
MKPYAKKVNFVAFTTIILLIIAFYSCSSKGDNELLLTKTTPSDFEDILTVDGSVEAKQSITITCPDDIDAEVVYLIKDGTLVKEGDVVCILENKDLQSEYDQSLIEVENARAGQDKTKAELKMRYALLDAQVKSIIAQTAIANLDSLQLQFLTPNQRRIKELELQKAAIEKQKLEKKLKALETINKSQMRGLELQLQQWENRVKNTKEKLDQLTLRASKSGLAIRAISMLTDNKVQEGDQVWSRMPLIVIPELSQMKVVIEASEANYKRINVNDPVEFSFNAMPGNFAWGKIVQKAPVGTPIKKDSKVKIFEIEASVDSSLILPEPGLTATCNVILQRIKDTIAIPQLAVFNVDSMSVVYVKKQKGFEERQVLTGPSSPNSTVIIAGLNGKEFISLTKPSSSFIKKHSKLPAAVIKKFSSSKP